jgi:glycosyltransferase involved in cell wall biosynthesis
VNVLFLSGEFPPMQGGVGDYTRELGLALHDLQCQVHIVTSSQAADSPDLTVHAVVERWDWSSWRIILDLIRHHQPDVVHIQYQAAAYAMHPAINLLPRRIGWLGANRPRTVVTFHDLKVPYLFPKAGPLRRRVVSELARRSDAAITTNREDYENLRAALGTPPALIPIGSNITPALPAGYNRDDWRARWGAGPDDFLLCFFGFINDRKGVDTLLRALSMLSGKSDSPTSPRLLFIGGQTGSSDPTNTAYLIHIESLIAELELEDRICWTGYVPDDEVSANFAAADLCVLPFSDGVSFLHGTFHAALAHSLPIVTTQPRVHLPELVNEKNVLLVPPRSPKALAQAISRLETTPGLRQILGDAARTLSGQFTWDKIARQTIDLYHTIGAGAQS